jgi:hypothetical protein
MAQAKTDKTNKSRAERTEVTATEIDPASPDADRQVMDTLLKMVTEDRNTTVAIFWAKARCGMNDKGSKKEQKANQVPTIVIRAEEKRS